MKSTDISPYILHAVRAFDQNRLAALRSSRTIRAAENAMMDASAFAPDREAARVHLARFLAEITFEQGEL